MSTGARRPPLARDQRLRDAKTAWGQAMTAHKMAPPDADFAARLRTLASAADTEREACEEAAQAGLLWRPIPGAQGSQPPYELRPGTGRRGPAELWERFDAPSRRSTTRSPARTSWWWGVRSASSPRPPARSPMRSRLRIGEAQKRSSDGEPCSCRPAPD